jgi:hypothetical protein
LNTVVILAMVLAVVVLMVNAIKLC